jgi:hypothetical protein
MTKVPYRVPFYPNMAGAHLLVSQLAGGILKHFFQELHQMFQGNFLIGFSSRVLGSAIFPTWLNLFLQGDDSAS